MGRFITAPHHLMCSKDRTVLVHGCESDDGVLAEVSHDWDIPGWLSRGWNRLDRERRLDLLATCILEDERRRDTGLLRTEPYVLAPHQLYERMMREMVVEVTDLREEIYRARRPPIDDRQGWVPQIEQPRELDPEMA